MRTCFEGKREELVEASKRMEGQDNSKGIEGVERQPVRLGAGSGKGRGGDS